MDYNIYCRERALVAGNVLFDCGRCRAWAKKNPVEIYNIFRIFFFLFFPRAWPRMDGIVETLRNIIAEGCQEMPAGAAYRNGAKSFEIPTLGGIEGS